MISLRYTKSHLLKLILCLLNFFTSLSLIVADMFSSITSDVVESTIYTFLWMFSIMLLRREYMKMGKTSIILICFWTGMMITPILMFVTDTYAENGIKVRYYMNAIILILNALVVLVCLFKRVDIGNIYSRSASAYHQLLKSYFVEDESIAEDKIWEKWDTLAEETTPIVERDNIRSMVIKETRETEEDGEIGIYYVIDISYGKIKQLNRTVLRRYREFMGLYKELKSAYPAKELPEFPRMMVKKSDVNERVVKERVAAFDELLRFIISEKLHCPTLTRFLSTKPENEISNCPPRERLKSTIQENLFTVSISKARKEKKKLLTHASYEIEIKCGKNVITTFHRFSDFKTLRKGLAKRHKSIGELPASYITKSSVNPKVVKERKVALESFLNSLLEYVNTKTDPEVISFLELDRLFQLDR
jgi:hypothetical protein